METLGSTIFSISIFFSLNKSLIPTKIKMKKSKNRTHSNLIFFLYFSFISTNSSLNSWSKHNLILWSRGWCNFWNLYRTIHEWQTKILCNKFTNRLVFILSYQNKHMGFQIAKQVFKRVINYTLHPDNVIKNHTFSLYF